MPETNQKKSSPTTWQQPEQQTDARPSRRERKKERTRQEIYTAAMDLFLARGFDAVTIEEICRAADVAKGTFFLHFPTKDSLLLEYGSQVTVELDAALHKQTGSAVDALAMLLDLLTQRTMRHADIVRLVVREIMANPVTLAGATEQSRDILHILTAVVQRGQLEGAFRQEVEPRLAAGIITSAYLAIITEWVRTGGKFDLSGAVQQSLNVVLYGLVERAATDADGN